MESVVLSYFNQMKIIDFHTHYYPDKVVKKALSAVQGKIPVHTDGSRDGLLESMQKSGVDASLNLTLVNNPANAESINRWAAAENAAPIWQTGSVHPAQPDPAGAVETIAASGLRGLKFHPEYQDFEFTDPRLFPVWERCIDLDLFVVTHAGYDVMFREPWHTDPVHLAEFHRRYPRLKLVLAHLGSMAMWDEVEEHLAGLPVYLDLAFVTLATIEPKQLLRIIRRHGAERILFGSDTPWCDQSVCVDFISSLPLAEEERELIFHGNAERLLKL